MLVNLVVTRSDAWVATQRLVRGENVPNEIDVAVNPSKLTENARRILLWFGNGRYPDGSRAERLRFSQTYEPAGCGSYVAYGSIPLKIDSDNPTPFELSQALSDAAEELLQKRTKFLCEQNNRQEAAQAAKAAEDENRRRLDEARQLLAEDWQRLEAERDQLAIDRDILAEFLSRFSDAELHAEVRRQAGGTSALLAAQKRIEDASPYRIFHTDIAEDE